MWWSTVCLCTDVSKQQVKSLFQGKRKKKMAVCIPWKCRLLLCNKNLVIPTKQHGVIFWMIFISLGTWRVSDPVVSDFSVTSTRRAVGLSLVERAFGYARYLRVYWINWYGVALLPIGRAGGRAGGRRGLRISSCKKNRHASQGLDFGGIIGRT